MTHRIDRIDLRRNIRNHWQEYTDAIRNVLEDAAFSGGSYVENFEQTFAHYCGVKACSGVNNGTSALHCAMMALGIGPGDEVIVPANTYIATAWGVTYTGALPVFVDCTPDTWEVDPDKIEAAITKRTRAVIGVHLYGQPFEFKKVKQIADRYGLYVVEDCAQAHGALYEGKMVGGLGEMGCFSFYPGKNLYAFGEGGCVTSNQEAYIRHINRLKNQGCDVRYYHEETGYNMRMEGIQGAVLSVSLNYLDEWTKRRVEIGSLYLSQIHNPLITMQKHPEHTKAVFHLFVVTTPDRTRFMEHMEQAGIRCDMHYPVPCHLQKAYAGLGYGKGDCPNAEYLSEHCCSLPMYPELTKEEVIRVIDACNSFQG